MTTETAQKIKNTQNPEIKQKLKANLLQDFDSPTLLNSASTQKFEKILFEKIWHYAFPFPCKLTFRATELSDSINEAFMELRSPAEAGLGICRQDQAGITRQVGSIK